ncbi:sulfatase family protein [Membranihabitans maritimus]|uniref:sulfatase family protein n=1 Tax=Membranihabitans maritimus TaxID=2904244 RepID=UPI001F461E2A|nr:sulfatase [Membranihabitans maritimus]
MFRIIFITLLIPLLFLHCHSGQPEEKTPPNFIIFIADDISWNDFGCYGNDIVQTPNIDRIASEGILFHNTYLTASSCSPSRISIITGRYPHNTGAAELHTEPEKDFSTIASILHSKNYYTGHAGKWHMGQLIKQGFDTVQVKGIGDGGEDLWIQSLRDRDPDKPFFFWFASLDAHRPWGKNPMSGVHSPSDIEPPLTLFDGDSTRKDLAKYYDEIARFDDFVGQVEKELDMQGQLNNTVMIIMADNGRPFPRDKTRVYDSGMKTPFIIKWPEGITHPGTQSYSLISSIDLAPTLIDLSGNDIPESFQGKSFQKVLKEPNSEFRQYVFSEHNWHDHEAYERMIRSKDFLYLINARPQFPNQGPADALNGLSFKELALNQNSGQLTPAQRDIFVSPRPEEELYEVQMDPLQVKNLADDEEYQDIKSALEVVLKNWMQQTGDYTPDTLTRDWYSRDSGKRIEKNFQIRGEMPGDKTNATEINYGGGFRE